MLADAGMTSEERRMVLPRLDGAFIPMDYMYNIYNNQSTSSSYMGLSLADL